MFDKKLFGSTLKALRTARGDSQAELGVVLGVTKTQVSDIENGKVATSVERLVALADYFGVSLDYLVGRSDDPYKL
ncbi:MAG: helix-turn-helix domain-containing protein [Clostridiales Family XIII bacterium]|jgi:transcriptional regulator with XRE-family HTH domain|nr:helix-turn-helix domain-containing protein [Clostridiales Family XIII bacterium]